MHSRRPFLIFGKVLYIIGRIVLFLFLRLAIVDWIKQMTNSKCYSRETTKVYNCLYKMFLLIYSRCEYPRLLSVRGSSPIEQLPDRVQLRHSHSKCIKLSVLIYSSPVPSSFTWINVYANEYWRIYIFLKS